MLATDVNDYIHQLVARISVMVVPERTSRSLVRNARCSLEIREFAIEDDSCGHVHLRW